MKKPKIAIIEDEMSLSDIYCKILQDEYEIVQAYDGEEGYELIKDEKPDLALIDVRMPKMDGIALIKKLKDEDLLKIPIIILTNLVEDERMAEAVEMGVKDYLSKEDATSVKLKEKIKIALT